MMSHVHSCQKAYRLIDKCYETVHVKVHSSGLLTKIQEYMHVEHLRIGTTTVQTFNSCTSRLDFCQCLVVQKPVDNMSKRYAKYINDPRSL